MSWLILSCVFLFFTTITKTAETNNNTVDLCASNSKVNQTSYLWRETNSEKCGCSENCIRKCCKSGFVLLKKYCVKKEAINESVLKVPIYVEKNVSLGELLVEKYVVGPLNCLLFKLDENNPADAFYLQTDGTLWMDSYHLFYKNDEYCVDDSLQVFLCFPEQDATEKKILRKIDTIGMIISMPFLLVTFLVYLILPDSNIHRRALMFYVLNLLLAYISLVTIQLHEDGFDRPFCDILGYSVVFFFMASFLWMNVMCADIWFAFRGMRGFNGRQGERGRRFLYYSLYAWGIPVLLVLILFLLNKFGNPEAIWYPGIGVTLCFLNRGLSELLYFYGPMAVIISIDILLFVLTAVKIRQVKNETSVLKQSDSKRHSYEDEQQKFNLYLKLLFAMGINWSMELISWAISWKVNSVPSYVWYLTDFFNAMYGVCIFFIFVFKKKIWKSLQKRYYVFIGKPHLARSMTTTTQTTRSSNNYSTTDASLHDQRLSDLREKRAAEERALTSH